MSAQTKILKLPFWPRVIGCVFLTYILCMIFSTVYPPDQQFQIICILIALCLLLLFCLSRYRVEISGHELSYFGLTRWRINRRDIAAYHTELVGDGLYVLHIMVLVPRNKAQLKRTLGFWFYETTAFQDWLADAPEIGSAADEASEPALTPAPAPTQVRHRSRRNAKAPHIPVRIIRQRLKRVIFGFYAIYGIMFLGDLFLPQPPVWWTFLFFAPPLFALLLELIYPEYVRLAAKTLPQDKRASRYKRVSVAGVFFLPCILLPLWQLEEMHFLDIWRFVIIIVALTTLFTAYVIYRAPDLCVSLKLSAGVLIYALGGACALTNITDTVPDRGNFTTSVTKIAYLKRTKYIYHAEVEPVSDWTAPTGFYIRGNFYRHLSIGETVCVRLHPGAIDIRWYSLNYCSKNI